MAESNEGKGMGRRAILIAILSSARDFKKIPSELGGSLSKRSMVSSCMSKLHSGL